MVAKNKIKLTVELMSSAVLAPKRDASRTQSRILAAATAEFAAKGLAGARVDEHRESASSAPYSALRKKFGRCTARYSKPSASCCDGKGDPQRVTFEQKVPYNTRAIIDACRAYEYLDVFPPVAEASPELEQKLRKKWKEVLGS